MVTLLLLAVMASQPAAEPQSQSERLLVGVILNSKESGAMEVLRHGSQFHVPLDEFARLTGARLETEQGTTRVFTSLGEISLSPDELRTIDGIVYVPDRVLGSRLATTVRFDTEEYALRLRVPWESIEGPQVDAAATPRADITAPRYGLSAMRFDLTASRSDGSDYMSGVAELGGRLGQGFWRMRYRDDLEGRRVPEAYSWYRQAGRFAFLAGQQTARVHPLLNGVRMTGVQTAWTNRPGRMYARAGDDRELLPRQISPTESFAGNAPAGSLVRLEIDGTTVAQQLVGFDGRYAFTEVTLPSRRLSRAQVTIYDRRNLSVPIGVDEFSIGASELLLDRGAVVHLAGAGRSGNMVEGWMDSSIGETGGAAGFYQWRQGITRRLTFEAGVQTHDSNTQWTVGTVARLSPGFVASLAAGQSSGAGGYLFGLDGYLDRLRFRASSRYRGAGFAGPGSLETWDHLAEGWYEPGNGLRLGWIARARQETGTVVRYFLPAAVWSRHGWFLQARPDLEGDYDLFGSWRPGRSDRISVASREVTSADWSHRFGERNETTVGAEFVPGGTDRHSLLYTRLGAWRRSPSWSVGVAARGDEIGGLASATVPIMSGVLARLDYQSVPLATTDGGFEETEQIQLGIHIDLAWAGGRLVPGSGGSLRPNRGSLAGRVVMPVDFADARWSLRDINVMLDGRVRARTGGGGHFVIGNLEPGVYYVELDPENLPIELVIQSGGRTVEVAAGVTSRVDFQVEPRFGIAGRVTDAAGAVVAGIDVELIDRAGWVAATGRTDAFGLYRLDGVRPGGYSLRVVGSEKPVRPVTVVDEFLFEQNLVLPAGLNLRADVRQCDDGAAGGDARRGRCPARFPVPERHP